MGERRREAEEEEEEEEGLLYPNLFTVLTTFISGKTIFCPNCL